MVQSYGVIAALSSASALFLVREFPTRLTTTISNHKSIRRTANPLSGAAIFADG
jgi:hypothetical protein